MSFYDFPLWAKVVGPILIFLFSFACMAGYYFTRRIKFKTDDKGQIAWYNRAWPIAIIVVGVLLLLFGIGYIVASTNTSLFGGYSS